MNPSDIPEEMVEKAARRAVYALARQLDMDPDKLWTTALQPSERDWYRSEARAVLSAALEGCAVVQLPEPDGNGDYETGYSSVWINGVNRVTSASGSLRPENAESYGAALIAAAREAKRRASGSGVGEQPETPG